MRVLGLEGAVYTDIAEDRNRIVIGIDRQKASVGRSNVQRTIARLGVPPGMVEMVETVGFVIDAYKSTCNPCAPGNTSTGTVSEATYAPTATTLSSRIRPLEGGIETDYFRQADGFYYGCSLGFLAYRSQQRVLITASHCSADFGAPDGTGYYQPTVEAGNYIGAEIADPTYTTAQMCDDPDQPGTSRPCRDSDALAAVLATDVTWLLGNIAKPTGSGTFSYTDPGSTTIDTQQPHLTIIAKGSYPDANMILDKIGRTTGWTYGYVAQTCVNLRAPDLSKGVIVVLRCQDLVESTAQGGDSGAPVFQWASGGVTLYGIVSARRQNGMGLSMSAMSNIEYDLGTLTVY